MRTLLSKFESIRHRWLGHNFGWTGIEIGCHDINMAQVQKFGKRWQLGAVWSVEHSIPYKASATEMLAKDVVPFEETFGWIHGEELMANGLSTTLEHLQNLNSLFHGHNCATTLMDGMIDYRELDLPSCDLAETKEMVRSEIALEAECELEDLLTDCWDLPQTRARNQTACFAAVSLSKATAIRFANDLLKAGFECKALDAVPCAIARATAMVIDGEDEIGATLSIDIGYQQATVVLVKNGQPLLTRTIRSLGLLGLLENIAAAFGVSMADAQTLLFQTPTNRSENESCSDEFANPLQQKLGGYLQALTVELDRTIHFASQVCRSATPSQLLLMGPGTRIQGFDQEIASRIELPANLWSIDSSENLFGKQCISAYAIASALSALAWEAK